ncbi:MAG: hypothetical protein ACRCVG_06045 [Methanobacteriaceae archaeon]
MRKILKNQLLNSLSIGLSLLFLLVISLSVSYAADININNNTEGGLNKTVTDAQNGDVIILEGGTYSDNVTNIVINKNITLMGKNKETIIIDAQKFGRIFNITTGNNLTLIKIVLINGNNNTGGAIYNNGDLTLTSCIIDNSSGTNGGAIYNNGKMNITNCQFNNNNADWGGAIYFTSNTLNTDISSSNFTNNSAVTYGGAICYQGGDLNTIVLGNVTIKDSIFSNNSVSGFDVVLYLLGTLIPQYSILHSIVIMLIKLVVQLLLILMGMLLYVTLVLIIIKPNLVVLSTIMDIF